MTHDGLQIRILLLEDNEADAEIIELELRRAGFDPIIRRVWTEAALREALTELWDVVLSDFRMPQMNATVALSLVRELAPHLPFIVLSGSVGEESAVEIVKAGAHDFFLKDRLGRLPNAITRELREARNRAERERVESRLLSMFEQAIVGIAQIDPAGHVELANDEFCRIVGRARRELDALVVADLVHPDDREGYLETFDRLTRGRGNHTAEHRMVRPDGTAVWVLDTVSANADRRGHMLAVTSVMKDITERKRASLLLEESELRFRRLADSAPVMLWMTDARGACVYVNKPWHDFTGILPSSGATCWLEAVHDEDLERVERTINAAVARKEPFRIEYRLRRRDGEYGWALDTGIPRFDDAGELLGYIGSVIDITERKTIEQERERVVDDLSRTIRLSETFVGVLSHDLRNPLAAITTASSLLLERRELSERSTVPVTRILSSANRMARMIDQLLDFTRIRFGGGQLSPEPVNLAEVCHACVDEVLVANDGVDIRLEVRGKPDGHWDRGQLSQLVSNLVANAAQHRRRPSAVVVAVDGTQSDTVRLSVHNEGSIPEDLRASMFEPFRARTGRTGGSSGLGLGLYISQHVARAHGGDIHVESGEAIGTRFVVDLPRRAG